MTTINTDREEPSRKICLNNCSMAAGVPKTPDQLLQPELDVDTDRAVGDHFWSHLWSLI